jgi:hypothetical protein
VLVTNFDGTDNEASFFGNTISDGEGDEKDLNF